MPNTAIAPKVEEATGHRQLLAQLAPGKTREGDE